MLKARVSLAACLFAAAFVTISCDNDVVAPEAPDPQNFSVRLGGALEVSFDKNVTAAREHVLLLMPEGQASLSMFFQMRINNDSKNDEVSMHVTFPVTVSKDHPEPGIYEHRYEAHSPFFGNTEYRLTVPDASDLQVIYNFRGIAVQLRLEESSADHVKGDLHITAKQVRGLIKSYGQLQDVRLANDGQIAIAVKFDVPLTRQ